MLSSPHKFTNVNTNWKLVLGALALTALVWVPTAHQPQALAEETSFGDEGCVDNDGTADDDFSGTECTKRSTCKVNVGSQSKCMKKSDGKCYCTSVDFALVTEGPATFID